VFCRGCNFRGVARGITIPPDCPASPATHPPCPFASVNPISQPCQTQKPLGASEAISRSWLAHLPDAKKASQRLPRHVDSVHPGNRAAGERCEGCLISSCSRRWPPVGHAVAPPSSHFLSLALGLDGSLGLLVSMTGRSLLDIAQRHQPLRCPAGRCIASPSPVKQWRQQVQPQWACSCALPSPLAYPGRPPLPPPRWAQLVSALPGVRS
jgi:hypothetical protein